MTIWTETYAKTISTFIFHYREMLNESEVDEIVIDMMALIDRVMKYERPTAPMLYRILLPCVPFLRNKAGESTRERLGRLESIMLDIVNLKTPV